jgi:hypothetical protein
MHISMAFVAKMVQIAADLLQKISSSSAPYPTKSTYRGVEFMASAAKVFPSCYSLAAGWINYLPSTT